ncbi:MAG TPA: hypothetical protein PKL60_01165 [Anaerolineaceae bacterium]|nr:hypothetical protein [Anaerolineaceae bacterium]
MDDITSFEQLEKRVQWLDNERRNDKTNLASLQNRLTGLESENISLHKQIKDLELELSGLKNQISSLDKYENRIERLNIDLTKQVRDVNERAEMNLNEAVKRLKLEIDATKRSLSEIYQIGEQLEPIRNELKSHKVEDARLARLIEELKGKIQEVSRFDEDYRRSLHLLEENYRQENKRLNDFQGDLAAHRKRVEDTRSRFDVFSDSFRTLDVRITELQTFEKDRKEAQSVFIEKVNNSLLDKEKTFRVWEKRFGEIDQVKLDLNTQLADLENARKALDKSISSSEEVVARFERRINEISEIQRLNDERFRQEWNSFKADDLKRWTNYLLGQEEQLRTINQQLSSAHEELEALKDSSVKIQDELDKLTRETFRSIQSILGAYQESIQSLAPLAEKKAQ